MSVNPRDGSWQGRAKLHRVAASCAQPLSHAELLGALHSGAPLSFPRALADWLELTGAVLLPQFPMPAPGVDPLMDDDGLEVGLRQQSSEALLYNLGATGAGHVVEEGEDDDEEDARVIVNVGGIHVQVTGAARLSRQHLSSCPRSFCLFRIILWRVPSRLSALSLERAFSPRHSTLGTQHSTLTRHSSAVDCATWVGRCQRRSGGR